MPKGIGYGKGQREGVASGNKAGTDHRSVKRKGSVQGSGVKSNRAGNDHPAKKAGLGGNGLGGVKSNQVSTDVGNLNHRGMGRGGHFGAGSMAPGLYGSKPKGADTPKPSKGGATPKPKAKAGRKNPNKY